MVNLQLGISVCDAGFRALRSKTVRTKRFAKFGAGTTESGSPKEQLLPCPREARGAGRGGPHQQREAPAEGPFFARWDLVGAQPPPFGPSLKTEHGCAADQTVRFGFDFEDIVRSGILFHETL